MEELQRPQAVLKQVSFKTIEEKTVKHFLASLDNREWMLIFTDGTFAIAGWEGGWEFCDGELENAEFVFYDWSPDKLEEYGMVAAGAIEAYSKAERDRQDRKRKEERLTQYQILKQEFGGDAV